MPFYSLIQKNMRHKTHILQLTPRNYSSGLITQNAFIYRVTSAIYDINHLKSRVLN